MALNNPLFDDITSHRDASDVDLPKNEESTNVVELVNDPTQTASKPIEIVLSSETVLNSVRELLECPVCMNRMYPPIHQCSNGHAICPSCKPRVQNQCPTCRHELGNIRCLALEKVAESFALPCKYVNFHAQAGIQAEVQAEVSKNWPMQVGEVQDAGLSDQAPSWMQGLEDRIVHRIVQRMENMTASEMAKMNDKFAKMQDEMEKRLSAKLEDRLEKMEDEMEKRLAKLEDRLEKMDEISKKTDHMFAQLSLPPPPQHP